MLTTLKGLLAVLASRSFAYGPEGLNRLRKKVWIRVKSAESLPRGLKPTLITLRYAGDLSPAWSFYIFPGRSVFANMQPPCSVTGHCFSCAARMQSISGL